MEIQKRGYGAGPGAMQTHSFFAPKQGDLNKEMKVFIPYGEVSKSGLNTAIRIQTAARTERQAKQAENGLIEFPFGLFHESGQRVAKRPTVFMTEKEAAIRNKSVRDVGFVWRRIGY